MRINLLWYRIDLYDFSDLSNRVLVMLPYQRVKGDLSTSDTNPIALDRR